MNLIKVHYYYYYHHHSVNAAFYLPTEAGCETDFFPETVARFSCLGLTRTSRRSDLQPNANLTHRSRRHTHTAACLFCVRVCSDLKSENGRDKRPTGKK